MGTRVANVFREARVTCEIDDELSHTLRKRWPRDAMPQKREGRSARRCGIAKKAATRDWLPGWRTSRKTFVTPCALCGAAQDLRPWRC